MMDKYALYEEAPGGGPAALLLDRSEGQLGHTKLASFDLLPEVSRYIDELRPLPGKQYLLINAMGASDYWGCNANADSFGEQALVNVPDGWAGHAETDRALVMKLDWTYGYPTFYLAHLFAHHRNQDPAKRLGDVEFTTWNDRMKRVELVAALDEARCGEHGGSGFLSRINNGEFPCVSMGARVKWDACSICTDWPALFAALKTYDPKRHANPGLAVLEVHERIRKEKGIPDGVEGGIKGVGRNRREYCSCMRLRPRQVDPSTGKQVFVYNFFPKFFDISLVTKGAVRTARVMHRAGDTTKLAEESPVTLANLYSDPPDPQAIKEAAIKKARLAKRAEIDKRIDAENVESIPALARGELDLPKNVLNAMGGAPVSSALGSAGSLGIVLRPREFQRVMIVSLGLPQLADQLDSAGQCFGYCRPSSPFPLDFSSSLAGLLQPFVGDRSGFAPMLRSRVTMIFSPKDHEGAKLGRGPLMDKLAEAYQNYRKSLLEYLPAAQSNLAKIAEDNLQKLASCEPADIYTPLSYAYFKLAFQDEVGT